MKLFDFIRASHLKALPKLCFTVVFLETRKVVGAQPTLRLAADGRFLINTVVGEASTTPITLIQNWNPQTDN